MSSRQKVRNWKEYNKSLQERGEIIFNFNKDYLQTLYYQGDQKQGGMVEYSEKMYEYLLTIKVLLRLPWRATIGFANGLLKKAFPDEEVRVPNFAHACREAANINIKIKQYLPIDESGIELGFDSTGISVYTTSGYHQRKHGKHGLYKKKEQWKKIHIALDLNNQQVMGMEYSDSNVNDCEVVRKLSKAIKCKVKNAIADGAYDTEECYKIAWEWDARAIIPPSRVSKSQDELVKKPKVKKEHLKERDNTIREIRKYKDFEEGLKEWKINSGYHKRSRIESFMFRLKRTFGFYLQHKKTLARVNEMVVKINLLNEMAALGAAKYSNI